MRKTAAGHDRGGRRLNCRGILAGNFKSPAIVQLPPKAKHAAAAKKAAISGSFSKKGKNLPAVAAGLAVVLGRRGLP